MPYILIIIKLKLTYFRWKEYEIEIYLFIQLNGTVWSNFQNVLGFQL